MLQQGITPHESTELHEVLTFKNLCLTKSVTMSALVSDDELKSILQRDITKTKQHIEELRGLMEQSSINKLESIRL